MDLAISSGMCSRPKSRTGHHHYGWVRKQVHRICDLAELPRVTAHAMRGTLATVGAQQDMPSEMIARYLDHGHDSVTREHYAKPGEFDEQARRRGLVVLKGGRE